MSDKNKDGGIDRRQLLRIAGGAGAFVGLQGTVVGNSNRQRRVPRTLDMDGNAKTTMKVPKEWHNHFESVRPRKEDFDDEYAGTDGLVRTSVVIGDEKQGGRNGFALKMVIHPDEFEEEPPDEYRGLEVEVEESGSQSEPSTGADGDGDVGTNSHEDDDDCFYNNHNWSTIPGGIPFWKVSSSNRTGGWPSGTTAWEVEYQGNRYIQSAQHTLALGGCTTDDITGTMSYQHDQSQGPAKHQNSSLDAILIDPNQYDFYDIINEIINEDGTETRPVTGVHSAESIAYMISDPLGGVYEKMGSVTGRTSGTIDEMYVTRDGPTCDYDGHGVKGGADVNNGDSGGPAFTRDGDGAELVYMVTHGATPETDDIGECEPATTESQGPAAYHLQNEGFTPVQE